MHARLDDLINLRAALRGLPDFAPPAHSWERLAQRLSAGPERAPRSAAAGLWTALAVASLAGLVAAAPWWMLAGAQRAGGPAPEVAAALQGAVPPVTALVQRSQQLEATLQAFPQRPAVRVAANSAAIDALQERIEQLDAEMASAVPADRERTVELWSTRVRLLNSLVGVRYAEAVHAGYAAGTTQGEI